MPNAIHEIIVLSGGLKNLTRLEIQPKDQPKLTIIKTGDWSVRVVVSGRIECQFEVTGAKPALRCPSWTPALDAILRKRGYIEAALHFHLSPS